MSIFGLNVQMTGFYCIDAMNEDQAKEHLPHMIDKDKVERLLCAETRIQTTDVLNSEDGSSYQEENGIEIYPFDVNFLVYAVVKETGLTKEEAIETLIGKLKVKASEIEDAFMIGIRIEVEGKEIN
ncbi:hypothetical protein SMD22_00700 (plasmid) [Brevibacillus halotolerans]|nr:hypothetical protein SMD22_00700 [Brevibacillus halotolerans]